MDWQEIFKEKSKQTFEMKNITKLKPNRERQILLGVAFMWNKKKIKLRET